MTAPQGAWLVVIDMQWVFADPASGWATPGFRGALAGVQRLVPHFGERVVFTRFVAPPEPVGAWRAYYQVWPWALRPAEASMYRLVPELEVGDRAVLDATTFGKWGPALESATDGSGTVVLAGVSTDCCVLSTALAAADAGITTLVAADACAGASATDHQRALDAMALYTPHITITSVAELVGDQAPIRR